MSSIIGRAAFRATPRLRVTPTARLFDTAAEKAEGVKALKTGAKRDPELYVLFGIMTAAFAGAGYALTTTPTSSTSERDVAKAPNSEPWNQEGGSNAKYQYYPGGDQNAPKKDAPSALNEVVIPNVNLPKELHDLYNKFGKDDY